MSLIDKLRSKGYNIEGLDINQIHERYIEVKKSVKNAEGIDIDMTITLCINNWGGSKNINF